MLFKASWLSLVCGVVASTQHGMPPKLCSDASILFKVTCWRHSLGGVVASTQHDMPLILQVICWTLFPPPMFIMLALVTLHPCLLFHSLVNFVLPHVFTFVRMITGALDPFTSTLFYHVGPWHHCTLVFSSNHLPTLHCHMSFPFAPMITGVSIIR